MEMQDIIANAMKAKRADDMLTSPQLTLGELILKLEAIPDKKLPVIFDGRKYFPTGIDSWRGSYCELAINYSTTSVHMTVKGFLNILRNTVGRILIGYKGGDFMMGKTTPVWVSNYGESWGFKSDGDIHSQAVTNIFKAKGYIVIRTKAIEY